MKNAKQEFYNQQKQPKKEDEIKTFSGKIREFITSIFTLKKTQKMFLSQKENKPT